MLEDRRLLALTTTDLNTGLTATDLAQALIGGGVIVSNVTYTGNNAAAGLFSGGISEGLGIESGVLLSCGDIADAAGPNNTEQITTEFDTPGDPDLEGLIPGFETNDAAVLEFDFIGAGGTFTFEYVFASEEYNEFVDSPFNDVFGFFLDGQNIALLPGTNIVVSINNVNNDSNSQFYNDNSLDDLGDPTPFLTQADGFTVVLQATGTISPGSHHIKLAIADASDEALDSWVFLKAESFVSGDSDVAVEISDSPDPAILGAALTYNVVVTNNGPDPATGVTLTDLLPAGLSFVGANASQGSVSESGGVITADLGTIPNGETASIVITVIPHELGTVVNSVTVEAFQIDDTPENNSASTSTTVIAPSVFIDDVQVVEGNSGTRNAVFTVFINGVLLDGAVTVQYYTTDVTANGGTDFVPVNGTIVIPAGENSRTITVPIVADVLNEATETFLVNLYNPTIATIGKGTGVGTIIDDDRAPALYVNDVQVKTTEAGTLAAVFTVALDLPSGRIVRVQYGTIDGTAQAGIDYVSQSGELLFAPGIINMQVTVPVTTSDLYSANELFALQLANPVGAVLADSRGVCIGVFAAAPPLEYILDDGGPGYVRNGAWGNVTNLTAYHSDYDYHDAGNGSATATWTVTNLAPGPYEVFARWVPFTNRATNAPFTVLDGATSRGTVLVNQRLAPAGDLENGITWQSLGTFQIASGVLSVRLSNNANGYVIADAVRIVPNGIPAQVPEMDVAHFGDSIDDDELTPTASEGTAFGNVLLATDSPARTFTITNTGNAPLHLTGSPRVQVLGDASGDFIVVSQPAAIVAPGGSTSFAVVFHPTTSGLRQATVSIGNNDSDEAEYRFLMEGVGTDGTAESPPAQNFVQPLDVNGDLRVAPQDILIVFNALLQQSAGQSDNVSPLATSAVTPLASSAAKPGYYLDVDGNGMLTPRDALLVINYLLRQAAEANELASPAVTVSSSTPSAALQAFAVDEAISELDEPSAMPLALLLPSDGPVVTLAGATVTMTPLVEDPLAWFVPVDESDSDDELDLHWE